FESQCCICYIQCSLMCFESENENGQHAGRRFPRSNQAATGTVGTDPGDAGQTAWRVVSDCKPLGKPENHSVPVVLEQAAGDWGGARIFRIDPAVRRFGCAAGSGFYKPPRDCPDGHGRRTPDVWTPGKPG